MNCQVRTRKEPGKLHLTIHHPAISAPAPAPPRIPKLFQDPADALYRLYGGEPASFECPIDRCVGINGLGFHDDGGWHPFIATLHEYAAGAISGWRGSSLQRYYERWQPGSLHEALPGLPQDAPSMLRRCPSHLLNLYPWSAKSVRVANRTMRAACYRDNVEHGRPDLTTREHGYKGHGPVSEEVMHLEYQRLTRVYDSLATHGYRRECGDVRVLVVRREGEYRFILSGGGLHRTAAMKALGYESVPATFNNLPAIFDKADVPRWTQVSEGVWSRSMAEAYVDSMFDFDAYAWASRNGLVRHERREEPAPRAGIGNIAAARTMADARHARTEHR